MWLVLQTQRFGEARAHQRRVRGTLPILQPGHVGTRVAYGQPELVLRQVRLQPQVFQQPAEGVERAWVHASHPPPPTTCTDTTCVSASMVAQPAEVVAFSPSLVPIRSA